MATAKPLFTPGSAHNTEPQLQRSCLTAACALPLLTSHINKLTAKTYEYREQHSRLGLLHRDVDATGQQICHVDPVQRSRTLMHPEGAAKRAKKGCAPARWSDRFSMGPLPVAMAWTKNPNMENMARRPFLISFTCADTHTPSFSQTALIHS